MAEEPALTFERHPEAEALANPLKTRLILIEDLETSTELIREAIPIREIGSLSRHSPWWHYGTNLPMGGLVLGAGISPPARAIVDPQTELSVILGYGGEQRIRQASRTWKCHEDTCLLLAGESYVCESTLSSAAGFQLLPDRLLRTAMAMGGWSSRPAGWTQLLQEAHGWQVPADPNHPSLQNALRQVITMAERLTDFSLALLDRLQLEDQIYRLLAAMLLPELQRERPVDRLRHRERQGIDTFDEMIDYIRANLDQPLNLTELESRSHYSRRALQYAFRERLGCTASQWIRQQRLEMALQRLQNPMPGDTVGSIAMGCGYRSLNLFSVDFQQRFHIKPSQLLRESLSCLPSEAR